MGNQILIIDDSPIVCRIIEVGLRRQGYKVQCYLSGEAAIDILSSSQSANKEGKRQDWTRASHGPYSPCLGEVHVPDLVIIDLDLPRMDGYSVIRHLRSQPIFSEIPLVILSGRNSLIDKLKGQLAGASDYVEKPFMVDHLLSVVQSHLSISAEAGLAPA